MEFYEVINKRHSIREFQDKQIPREILERILNAGLKAPSSNHQRQWELVAITDNEQIQALAKLIKPGYWRWGEAKTPQAEMFKYAYPLQRSMVEQAACVILPYFKCKYDLKDPKNNYGLSDYGATWALIENILLAATAEKLGSGLHIPVGKEAEKIAEFISAKDGYYLPAVLVLGYAKKDAFIPRQVEATVENKVHWEKW